MGMTTPIADHLSNLMYSYKYGNKEHYFKSLEWLKEIIGEDLYTFYFRFGCSVNWQSKGAI